ncbi:hypothetical protein C1H46_007499 [Malus baccata]|uniref:O-fucosyltransferase family protein n=1 Tax=Malus baccata TaxID=106549 RepID=A0A540N727_MALBA|nr:hypothetical protein C1H46_007499 [Malus baccata]
MLHKDYYGYCYPNQSQKAVSTGLLVVLFPAFLPNLFGPLSHTAHSIFSEWNAPKPRHLRLLNPALLQFPFPFFSVDQQSKLWAPLPNQGWKHCPEEPNSLSSSPKESTGYIQVFLDEGLNQQKMGVLRCYRYGVAAISPFSHRLAFDNLPQNIQRLRCKVNFQALAFVPHIKELGETLVNRLRYPPNRNPKAVFPNNFFACTYTQDIAAHSACDFGGGKAEKLALAKYRQVIWQGRVLKSQVTDEELRNQGRCPLTPEEIGLLLAVLGFNNTTRLYLASYKVYGGEARILTLRGLFPDMEDKKSLASAEERAKVEGKASLLATVDYYVSMQSDIFVSASPSNMHNALYATSYVLMMPVGQALILAGSGEIQ